MGPSTQICLVIGTPRGFTRSVLEALLKRGSRVILACSDPAVATTEHSRLSGLYGSSQISLSLVDPDSASAIESVLVRALDTHGGVTCIVNSTTDSRLTVNKTELSGQVKEVNQHLDKKLQQRDVDSINRISRLAVKYLGKQNGFAGGSYLNLTSSVELQPGHASCSPAAGCSVLGTTRALGLARNVARHGVRTTTLYQPTIDYPELNMAAQITDDQHTPYNTWSRYSAYCREYTGYMALHVADTAQPGTAWRFNAQLRLELVAPAMLESSCRIANKMCYWLGCPHVDDLGDECISLDEGAGRRRYAGGSRSAGGSGTATTRTGGHRQDTDVNS